MALIFSFSLNVGMIIKLSLTDYFEFISKKIPIWVKRFKNYNILQMFLNTNKKKLSNTTLLSI